MCAKISESGMVYTLTPGTPFSPRDEMSQKRNVIYQIGSVMSRRESRNIEFKAGGGNYIYNILPSAIQRYGSAFLNSNGGTLCIGVADDGFIQGVKLDRGDKSKITEEIRSQFARFTPPVDESFYKIDFVPCNRLSLYVLEIHVRSGNPSEIYADCNNKMHIKRDGSVQGPLKAREIREIVTSKFQKECDEANVCGDRIDAHAMNNSSKYPLISLSYSKPFLKKYADEYS